MVTYGTPSGGDPLNNLAQRVARMRGRDGGRQDSRGNPGGRQSGPRMRRTSVNGTGFSQKGNRLGSRGGSITSKGPDGRAQARAPRQTRSYAERVNSQGFRQADLGLYPDPASNPVARGSMKGARGLHQGSGGGRGGAGARAGAGAGATAVAAAVARNAAQTGVRAVRGAGRAAFRAAEAVQGAVGGAPAQASAPYQFSQAARGRMYGGTGGGAGAVGSTDLAALQLGLGTLLVEAVGRRWDPLRIPRAGAWRNLVAVEAHLGNTAMLWQELAGAQRASAAMSARGFVAAARTGPGVGVGVGCGVGLGVGFVQGPAVGVPLAGGQTILGIGVGNVCGAGIGVSYFGRGVPLSGGGGGRDGDGSARRGRSSIVVEDASAGAWRRGEEVVHGDVEGEVEGWLPRLVMRALQMQECYN